MPPDVEHIGGEFGTCVQCGYALGQPPWGAMNRRSPQSLLLLLPEVGSVGPVSGEKPKIKRYRLVRVRVGPPANANRLRR